MELISIVIPCYNEQDALPLFYSEICRIAKNFSDININMEFIFVDDGSNDNTLNLIKGYAKKDKRIHYISFSRNFGKEAAIYAGLELSGGGYAAIMDADLQDPPELLMTMYLLIKNENYDSVATRRITRKGEPVIRSFFAKMFYRIMNQISDIDLIDGARDYRLMSRKMVDALLSLKEYNRFTKGIFGWIGFKTKWLEYENTKRVAGETKWSFWKLFKYSIDGLVGFSTLPLMLASWLGVLICIASVFLIFLVVIRQLLFGGSAFGWPSLVCIISFFSGIQLLCIGILGQYVAKIYLETKRRPIYIVKEKE